MPRSSMPGTSITHITTSAITRVCSAHDIARSSAGAGFDGMMVSFLGTFCDAPALRPGGIDAGLRCAPAEPARQIAGRPVQRGQQRPVRPRSEEHTSELQSLMRISYAVFFLKKTQKTIKT